MSARFRVERIIGDGLGAEIAGDLRRDIGPAELAELRELYLEHSWLLFRGQEGLARAQQDVVATAFGTDQNQNGGEYEVSQISNLEPTFSGARGADFQTTALLFHSDGEFYETPLSGLILYALDVVDDQTCTRFANGHRAYLDMPPTLKARCEGRDALHVVGSNTVRTRCAQVHPQSPRWASPLLDQHQESGKPYLSLSEMFCDSVVGLPEDESEALLEELFAHYHDPRHVITHWWRKGDFVVWDNLMFVHARDDVSNVGRRVFNRNSLGEKSLTGQYEAIVEDRKRRKRENAAAAA